MADTDKDQKTHDPTEKKLQDARERGEIAMSPEVRHAESDQQPDLPGNAFLRKDRKQHQHRADAREQDQECGGFDRQGIHDSAPWFSRRRYGR